MTKLYHVVTVNDKTGKKVTMTAYAVPHEEAVILLKALNPLPQFPHVRRMLEQVKVGGNHD